MKLVPNEQVVEAVEFETTDPALRGEMTITTILTDAEGGTDILAVHTGLPRGLATADNETGWREALAKLAALVEVGGPKGEPSMNPLHGSLLQQLYATHSGDPWYGSSRMSLLAELTPAQAAASPIPGGHSIWQLVLHMTSWTLEVTRRLAGEAPREPVEGDWPPVGPVSAAAWDAALSRLSQAHATLLETARSLPTSRWADPVGESRDPAVGTGVDVAGMLVGLAQHDAYHTGQIAVLRRALAVE